MKKHKLTALATTALTFGIIAAPLANTKSASAGYMDDYFRNGMTIKLVTPKGFNVNLPYPTNGGMINTFEPDNTDDWKFVVIRSSTDGFKLKRIGTNHLITAKSFPAQNLTILQAWQDVGGEDKTQTWVATPTRPGFFAICLKAQRDQCMNVPNSTNRTKLTTYKFNINDQDQMFSAVSISSSTPINGQKFTMPEYYQRLYGHTQAASYRDFYKDYPHQAIDSNVVGNASKAVRALVGGEVKNVKPGKVVQNPYSNGKCQNNSEASNGTVEIWNPALQRTFTYLHFATNSIPVKNGDKVNPGDIIGIEGSTGCSTAPHTHLQVSVPNSTKKEDPLVTLGNARSQGILDKKYR